ncbi:hypothetical protein ACLB1Q_33650 [Escherichia coli]
MNGQARPVPGRAGVEAFLLYNNRRVNDKAVAFTGTVTSAFQVTTKADFVAVVFFTSVSIADIFVLFFGWLFNCATTQQYQVRHFS